MTMTAEPEPEPLNGPPPQLHASPVIPLRIGKLNWYCFCVRDLVPAEGHTSGEHLVLVHCPFTTLNSWEHDVFREIDSVPVRIHSECLFGDVFGSDTCDCGNQLSYSLETIGKSGCGVIVYLRQEGRGIGLFDKIRSLTVPNPDSFARNEALGLPADTRRYTLAATALRALGVRSACLLTGNSVKLAALRSIDIATVSVCCQTTTNVSSEAYEDVMAKIRRGYSYQLPGESRE